MRFARPLAALACASALGCARGLGEGGGALFARGGRLKLVNVRFFRNVCDDTGPDVGGGAVRAFDQRFETPGFPGLFVLAAGPPQVVRSTLE